MSTPLVPIAISSQLGVTGEERIHAAKYNPTIREAYVNFTINPPFASGLTNDIVDHQFMVSGGTPPYTWEVIGTLPTGYVDEGDGHFTGFMDEINTFTPLIKVTDSLGNVGTLQNNFTIGGYPFVAQLSETGTIANRVFRTTYGIFNRYDYTIHAQYPFDKVGGYSAIGNPGVIVDDYLISRIEYDFVGPQVSGVYSLKWNGAALVQQSLWQRSATIKHEYQDHVKWDESTVIVAMLDADDAFSGYLVALSVIDGSFAVLGELEIDTFTASLSMVVHDSENGKILVVYNYNFNGESLRAYSWNGSTFTLLDTYGGSLTGPGQRDDIVSDGELVYLPCGKILSWSGTAFVLEGSFTVSTYCRGLSVWKDVESDYREIHFIDSDSALKTYEWDGVTATLTHTLAGDFDDLGRCDSIQDDIAISVDVRPRQAEYVMPDPDYTAGLKDNGIFGGYSSLNFYDPFTLDYDNNDEPSRISFRFLEQELTANV